MKRELVSPLLEEIVDLNAKSSLEWSTKNYEASIALRLKMWDILPLPKEDYLEYFHICRSLGETYLLINNIEQAKKWSEEIYKCTLHRIDMGERDFLAGQVYFAMNDLETAKKYFALADKKSRRRLFKNTDIKYFSLLKKVK